MFLVVDDSRVMRQIVIRTLRQACHDGDEIIEAEDSRDASPRCTPSGRTSFSRTGTCRR
jgi:hypothetical protein